MYLYYICKSCIYELYVLKLLTSKTEKLSTLLAWHNGNTLTQYSTGKKNHEHPFSIQILVLTNRLENQQVFIQITRS